ncbi:regulator of protease activity HflC (stomatin/prohibitin superfamily) [Kribbella aluminosa]|uniref:Regulator of protease activity HflC (Stomatin/prohibitin superfamily) n=1 Tax=Kribbella aluminosa TaxID=416017 RepID=A0ABS4URN9_9ACTN|nr:SPFH domain-containing protein [Kribbella aluminosa]MBP2354300.1 regulator of protease activity HflC (stomatin/prohibitin superfamily) [Kribbella aluminosa]
MADITRFGFISHLRANPTTHVRHLRSGKVAHDGAGQAFWFRALNSSLSEIPIDDREQPLLFHGRTQDFQDVAVQATVTYRVTDPALAATRLDFGIDPGSGLWRSTPLEQLGGLLTELAQQTALDLLARMTLTEALSEGMTALRTAVGTGLREDARLSGLGIGVEDVRVVAVRAERDVEKALQTPTREMVQQAADKATYERRALAVERERSIAENELQNQIELARREEQLVNQRGQNERARATEAAAADQIETQAAAGRQRALAESEADAKRVIGAAEASAEKALLDAYAELDQGTILALAIKQGALPEIGTLNLTPDLITPLLTKLAQGAEA